MGFSRYLIASRHNSVWHVRIYIPKSLQPVFGGKTQIKRSTGLRDKAQAGRVAAIYWAKCQLLFDELELQMGRRKKSQTIKIGYATTVDALGREHEFNFGGEHSPEAAKLEQEAVEAVHREARELLQSHKDNPEVLRALTEASVRRNGASSLAPETTMSWEELFSAYEKKEWERVEDPTHRITETSYREYAPHRQLWKGYFAGRDVHTITRKEVKDIESWLRNLPSGFTKRGLSASEAITIAQEGKQSLKTVAAGTYNHYQRQVAGLLRHAYQVGAHAEDLSICISQMNAKRGQETVRVSFSNEDMQAMFAGAEHISNLGHASRSTPLAARFWVPLIAAFSGARMQEICQLKISDVRYHQGADCHYFHLAGNDELAADGEKKKIKNSNSIRPVPIHPTLVKIGLLNYLDSLKSTDSESSLFGLSRTNDGKMGSALSKWFTRKPNTRTKGFLERCGIETSGVAPDGKTWSKTFHCFRHTVVTNLRDKSKKLQDGSRVNTEDIAIVVGHLDDQNRSLETHRYGDPVENMAFRSEVIHLIQYPGVDFESIRWTDVT